MRSKLIYVFLFISVFGFSQKKELKAFSNLVNKMWIAEGNWGDGSKFKQKVVMNFDLDSTLIVVKSYGFIDKEQTKFGLRSRGIRQFDKKNKKIKFWEFDVFGELTRGEVSFEDKNVLYQYEYGDTKLTDMWEYIDENTYNFKVGSLEEGKWKQLYLNTQFKVEEK